MELQLTLFLPLLGMILLLFIKGENGDLIKKTAFAFSVLTLLVSIWLYANFDSSNPDFQFMLDISWIPAIDASFRIGIDGMSMLMIMLTTFITPIAILCSFDSIKKRQKEYYAMVLLLQFAMTGVFASLDLFLFYIFWEIILIPMYFIIGIWGGKDRLYATVKFFLFTVIGSLFMLVAVIWMGYYVGTDILAMDSGFTTNFLKIREVSSQIPFDLQQWLFLAFGLSFFIKVPLFPFHTWLPDAHTEAPTAGSVLLAGVLLKMGTYGLVRFNLDLFPEASIHYADIVSLLAVIGIIYGALVAMIQTDIKRLVAYTSVSHLGFVVLGIFSMTEIGLQGAIIQMVSHGLSTGMLFLMIGMLYERRHTRQITDYGGIVKVMPYYSYVFMFAMFSSIGLPGLNGFVGEYLTLLGAFQSEILGSYWYTIFGATGVIFAAVYLLWMYQRVFMGKIDNPENEKLKDMSRFEWAMVIPIMIFIVWIGIYPRTFLSISEGSTEKLVKKIEMIYSPEQAELEK
jgi:NADH-quinone oxidoreductase subunit M